MTNKKKTKKGLNFEAFDDVDFNKGTDLKAAIEAVGANETTKAEQIAEEVKPKKKPQLKEKKEELIRTTIDFPKSEHRKLKILAMEDDKKLYQYLYDIIKKHLDNIK